jgi:hypothetical protein
MRSLVTLIAALTLSVGAWAQGNCPRGNGQGRCHGQGQGQGTCKGKCDPANCTNPNCPRKQAGNTGTQQGNPNR